MQNMLSVNTKSKISILNILGFVSHSKCHSCKTQAQKGALNQKLRRQFVARKNIEINSFSLLESNKELFLKYISSVKHNSTVISNSI